MECNRTRYHICGSFNLWFILDPCPSGLAFAIIDSNITVAIRFVSYSLQSINGILSGLSSNLSLLGYDIVGETGLWNPIILNPLPVVIFYGTTSNLVATVADNTNNGKSIDNRLSKAINVGDNNDAISLFFRIGSALSGTQLWELLLE